MERRHLHVFIHASVGRDDISQMHSTIINETPNESLFDDMTLKRNHCSYFTIKNWFLRRLKHKHASLVQNG